MAILLLCLFFFNYIAKRKDK